MRYNMKRMSETQTLIQHLGALSYLGIFGAAMLANVALVVPEEVILLALGYLVGTGKANYFIVVAIVIAGLLSTDLLLYTLARRENKVIMFFYNKFFAWRIKSRLPWLEKHIYKVIFFSRFMVQLRFMGWFLAGKLKVRRREFITFELAALVIYVPLLIWAGEYFRDRIEFIASGVREIHNLIIIAIDAAILFMLLKFLRKLILNQAR